MASFYHKLAKYRITFSLLFVIAYLILSKPSFQYFPIGLALIIPGEGLRLWASGYLQKSTKLTISGPYAFVRNPLYLGNFLLGLGFILLAWNWLLLFLFLTLFIVFYYSTIKTEEERLQKIFGQQYLPYQKYVPLIIPRLRPFKGETKEYKWSLVRKNREYRTLLGIGGILAIQIIKIYFFS